MIDFVLRNLVELATLPGSVPKLRSFILDQAVRGNLTADWRREHPEVEPASVLLERIREEKRELVKTGKIKKQKELPPVDPEEVPFQVPEGWEWVRLGSLADMRLGKMLDKNKNRGRPRPYLRNINVRWYDFDLTDLLEMRIEDSETETLSLRHGDVLVCEGGEPGRAAVWDGRMADVYFQKAIHRVRFPAGFSPTLVVHWLRSDATNGRLPEFFTGAGIQHLTGKSLARYSIALPPADEQTEIVRRVDELLALCDQLEAVQTHRDDTRRRALAAGAGRLTDDTTDQPFADIWPRFTARLPELVQHPDDINPVQDTILQLAVRGRLTADWRATHPDTEPASTLIARIKEEKQAMVKAGKIKKQKELPPVEPGEVPFAVPESWEWARLGDLAEILNGDRSKNYPSKQFRSKDGIPFVSAGAIANGTLDTTQFDFISQERFDMLRAGKFKERDILFCLRGSLGKTGLVDRELTGAIASSLAIIRVAHQSIIERFALLTLQSPHSVVEIAKHNNGTAQPNLSANKLGLFTFPLPPLEEQTEIVRRVDELMALCNLLAAKHGDRATRAEQLLTTVLGTAS